MRKLNLVLLALLGLSAYARAEMATCDMQDCNKEEIAIMDDNSAVSSEPQQILSKLQSDDLILHDKRSLSEYMNELSTTSKLRLTIAMEKLIQAMHSLNISSEKIGKVSLKTRRQDADVLECKEMDDCMDNTSLSTKEYSEPVVEASATAAIQLEVMAAVETAPEVVTPEVAIPEIVVPEIIVPEVAIPEVVAPEVATPGMIALEATVFEEVGTMTNNENIPNIPDSAPVTMNEVCESTACPVGVPEMSTMEYTDEMVAVEVIPAPNEQSTNSTEDVTNNPLTVKMLTRMFENTENVREIHGEQAQVEMLLYQMNQISASMEKLRLELSMMQKERQDETLKAFLQEKISQQLANMANVENLVATQSTTILPVSASSIADMIDKPSVVIEKPHIRDIVQLQSNPKRMAVAESRANAPSMYERLFGYEAMQELRLARSAPAKVTRRKTKGFKAQKVGTLIM